MSDVTEYNNNYLPNQVLKITTSLAPQWQRAIELKQELNFCIGGKIHPDEKHPDHRYKHFRDNPPSVETIKAWAEFAPDFAYAILTGAPSGIVVVEADDEEAYQLVRKRCPPTPMMQRSGSNKLGGKGSAHFVYRYRLPDGWTHIPNRQYPSAVVIDGNAYHLDVRADKGLIVGPQSLKSGCDRRYLEVERWTADMLASVPVFDPSWLDYAPPNAHRNALDADSSHPDVPLDKKQRLAREWLLRRKGAEKGQGADDYAYALAIGLMWSWDLTPDEAYPLFKEWAEQPTNIDEHGGYCPWSNTEIWHKLEDAEGMQPINDAKPRGSLLARALEKEMPEVYSRLDELFPPKATKSDVKIEEIEPELPKEGLPVIQTTRGWTATELWNYKSKTRSLIPKVLMSGSHTLLSAREKRGKTHWVNNLIAEWLANGVVFNHSVDPLPIVYLDYEMGIDLYREAYFPQLYPSPDDGRFSSVEKHFRYFSRDEGRLPDYLTVDWLKEVIKGWDTPGIIVNDSVRGAFSLSPTVQGVAGWENDAGTVGKVLRPLTNFCHEGQWNLISVHHHNKSDNYSGSTEFGASTDATWDFIKEGDTDDRVLKVIGRGVTGRFNFTFNEGRYILADEVDTSPGAVQAWVIQQYEQCDLNQKQLLERRGSLPDNKVREMHTSLRKRRILLDQGSKMPQTLAPNYKALLAAG